MPRLRRIFRSIQLEPLRVIHWIRPSADIDLRTCVLAHVCTCVPNPTKGIVLSGINERTLRDYQTLMRDSVRMDAYRRAIDQTCTGRVVCEIGVGLGPLSLMALDAGAEKVYGIEVNQDVLELAERVIRDNGYDRTRFVAIPGISSEVELPEKVDVVLSETLDGAAFGENTAVFMLDARDRFLKPAGIFIPQRIECHTALATPNSFSAQCDFWNNELPSAYGFDYSAVGTELNRHNQTVSIESDELYSDWTRWNEVEFRSPESFRGRAAVSMRVTRPGLIRGFAISFKAILAEGVELSTFPSDPDTCWQQAFCPFDSPLLCEFGDTLSLDIKIEISPWLSSPLRVRVLRVPLSRDSGLEHSP